MKIEFDGRSPPRLQITIFRFIYIAGLAVGSYFVCGPWAILFVVLAGLYLED